MCHVSNLPAYTANFIGSQDRNFSLRRLSQAGDHSQQRGLPLLHCLPRMAYSFPEINSALTPRRGSKSSKLLDEIGDTYNGRRNAGDIGIGQ